MCFGADSRPPVEPRPVRGGALDAGPLVLTAEDGNRLAAWRSRPPTAVAGGPAVLVLPDQRGLHRYYEELADRFAELGYDALAIDFYGRTAGPDRRAPDWDEHPHIPGLRFEALMADVRAGLEELRAEAPDRPVAVAGFCLGGRLGFVAAADASLDLAGVVGFYGRPTGEIVWGGPAPIERIPDLRAPILGLFAGRDQYIPTERVIEYRDALAAAGADAEIVIYADAPHSFFDMLAHEYAAESADAWARTLAFLERLTSGSGRSS